MVGGGGGGQAPWSTSLSAGNCVHILCEHKKVSRRNAVHSVIPFPTYREPEEPPKVATHFVCPQQEPAA